ncbi:MAG: pyrroline-5-carboxylate reductase [Phocaeicola sp.]
MKITIIGGGNMGGAIARGLAKGTIISTSNLTVTDLNVTLLEELKEEYPEIDTSTDNRTAVEKADMVILAVKPWLVNQVLSSIKLTNHQVLVSVAAGITFEELVKHTNPEMTLFRLIPNTAIIYLESMNLIASHNASKEQEELMLSLFNEMGLSMLLPESWMAATTSLTSCGIAYVLKYIQAAMQAGVEMGVPPREAMKMVAQSVKGAAELILQQEGTHPSKEIDKVTTPGGLTIKGINELEHNGFSSTIIKAMKASR